MGRMTLHRTAYTIPSLGGPYPNFSVVAPRGDHLAIRGEIESKDVIRMSLKWTPQDLPAFRLPDYHRPIARCSGYESSIRGYSNRLDARQVVKISFEKYILYVSLVDIPPRDARAVTCKNSIAVVEGDCCTEYTSTWRGILLNRE